jgi:hypothetical protein
MLLELPGTESGTCCLKKGLPPAEGVHPNSTSILEGLMTNG